MLFRTHRAKLITRVGHVEEVFKKGEVEIFELRDVVLRVGDAIVHDDRCAVLLQHCGDVDVEHAAISKIMCDNNYFSSEFSHKIT